MDAIRNGRFTSSNIYHLVKKDRRSKPPKEMPLEKDGDLNGYIEEKLFEIMAGRGLNEEMKSKYTIWGNFVEEYFFKNYTKYSNYKTDSKLTVLYDGEIESLRDWYCGSPDMDSEEKDTTGELKCPFTLKSYLTAYMCKDINELRAKHPDGEKYYQQVMSNSILKRRKHCELIFFMPRGYAINGETESEIDRIMIEMANSGEPDIYNFTFKNKEFFPYLLNSDIKNIKTFNFTPPEEDKAYLLQRVVEAVQILKKRI